MVALGEHVAGAGKTFCLNLSAPFIIQFFKDPLKEVMPYVDFLFANESEAETYGKENNLGTDLSEIALAIARQPKVRGDSAMRDQPRCSVYICNPSSAGERHAAACGGLHPG